MLLLLPADSTLLAGEFGEHGVAGLVEGFTDLACCAQDGQVGHRLPGDWLPGPLALDAVNVVNLEGVLARGQVAGLFHQRRDCALAEDGVVLEVLIAASLR